MDGKGPLGWPSEEARGWKNSSVIPRHPPLNTGLQLLLEDVVHHLSNTFGILPTKISQPDF